MERNKELEKYILNFVKDGQKKKYTLYDLMNDEYNDRDVVNEHIQYLYSDGLVDGHYDCYELCTAIYGLTPLGEEALAKMNG